jgi:DNA invertase Pin-like site-specific DNA recombinase
MSIQEQINQCRLYAKQRGWVLPKRYIYVDRGRSGVLHTTRRAYKRMLTTATGKGNSPFGRIITVCANGMHYDIASLFQICKDLRSKGVYLHFVLDAWDTENADWKKEMLKRSMDHLF